MTKQVVIGFLANPRLEPMSADIVLSRTRLRPSKQQGAVFLKNCVGCRFVYNDALPIQKERHEVFAAARDKFLEENPSKKKKDFKPTESEKLFTTFDLKKLLPGSKGIKEASWLAKLDSQILQDSIINFGKTWKRIFQQSRRFSEIPKSRSTQQLQPGQWAQVEIDRRAPFHIFKNWLGENGRITSPQSCSRDSINDR